MRSKFWQKLTACCLLYFAVEGEHSPFSLPEKAKEIASLAKPTHLLTRAIYTAQFQLDPIFIHDNAQAAPLRDLLLGLMRFNATGKIVPAMAKNWFSEDGKTWLFFLDDQRWSNGEPVTASDFVASWRRLAAPQSASPLARYLRYMQVSNAQAVISGEKNVEYLGVEAVNAHTLKIQLENANYQLPQMLAHVALLPTYQGKAPLANQPFVSNGDYRLQKISPNQLLLSARHSAAFTEVQYQRLNEAEANSADLIENPPLTSANMSLPRLCSYFYEFNFADPILKNRSVRQAIKAMISSAAVGKDVGIVQHSLLPSGVYSEDQEPKMAEQLLLQAGILPTKPLTLTISFDNQAQHAQIANQLARALAQSDLFRVKLQALDYTGILQARSQHQFQLIRSGWCTDYPDWAEFLYPFHSQSLDNKMGYRNPNVDQMLEKLKNQPLTDAQRLQLIQTVSSQLEDDVVVLPLYQYQRKVKRDPTLLGIDPANQSEVIYSKDLFRQ